MQNVCVGCAILLYADWNLNDGFNQLTTRGFTSQSAKTDRQRSVTHAPAHIQTRMVFHWFLDRRLVRNTHYFHYCEEENTKSKQLSIE